MKIRKRDQEIERRGKNFTLEKSTYLLEKLRVNMNSWVEL